MRRLLSLGLCAGLLLAVACSGHPAPNATPASAAGATELVFLHLNDVYEITPLQNGQVGGLARVSTLRQRLLRENPLTLTTLGGDFVSPSAMGTAKVDGERLAGRQMVAVLNAVGIDVATLGNHEWDISKDQLVDRIAESDFAWVSGNVTWADGSPLPGVETTKIVTLRDPADGDGRQVRIGLVGAVLENGAPDWVKLDDPVDSLLADARALAGQVDLVVALTHQSFEDDERLAAATTAEGPIDLILGGHEHVNWAAWRGRGLTPIFKADANVRTVYVIRATLGADGALSVEPELVAIDPSTPEDPATQAVVERWSRVAFDAFRAEGLEPEEVVADVPVEMDGREESIRSGTTDLTDLVADAFLAGASGEVEGVQAAIYNSGSIRVDDVLPPGVLTQYDVIRILPFGGYLVVVDVEGSLLRKILDQGEANRGEGGFLQWSGITHSEETGWAVAGQSLLDGATYRIALTDFLLSGRESGLSYLTRDNPQLQVVDEMAETGEVRRMVIGELERLYPGSGAGDP
jgi:5'-nucleotidase